MLSLPPGEVFLEEPPAPGPYAAGDRICGKYRLVEPIGFGGMGAVWRAHNEILDTPVALKLIRSDARWSGSSERLLIEARAAAGLRHTSIVRVFDFGKTRHRDPFIVMELLQGESLRDLLDRERQLSAVEAVRHLLPILGGIGCAHARGIVHRDLKPENIFLARDDAGGVQPKVLDFGIAKREGVVSHLTGGNLLGSPEYMSPEQALGDDDVDHLVDIWAAAVVLYEMIAGRAPWKCSSCPALLRAIVDDPAPSLLGTRGVDARLWAILDRGLAKNREKRWTSARNFGRALAGWLSSRSIVDDVSGCSLRITWLAPEASATVNAGQPDASVETKQADETPWPVSEVLRRPGRRRKLTLGLTVPLAAALTFVAVGYRSSSAPAATAVAVPSVVVTPARADSLEHADSLAPADTLARTASLGTLEVGSLEQDAAAALAEPPPRARPAERANGPRRAPAAPTKPAIPSAAPVSRTSARSMDFGF
jgi:serine/threonine protein kinase